MQPIPRLTSVPHPCADRPSPFDSRSDRVLHRWKNQAARRGQARRDGALGGGRSGGSRTSDGEAAIVCMGMILLDRIGFERASGPW